MDKPLKDWTLEEIRKECDDFKTKHFFSCKRECKFYDFCNRNFGDYSPAYWDESNGWNDAP